MSKLRRAFVTGDPISHSRSPIIHHYWLTTYNIDGRYDAILNTIEDFPFFIKNLSHKNFCGGNVTLPHKETAFRLADCCDEAAQAIGAANTLWLDDGRLYATNTDSYGFLANLDDALPGWSAKTAVVLGAGGAARSIIHALKVRHCQKIVVFNRTLARALMLKKTFGEIIDVQPWENRQNFVKVADLIVNTTSVEMEHQPDMYETPLLELGDARPTTIVTDVVYTPLFTPFLKHAKSLGLPIVDGLGMLLHQAVPGFEKWFGIRPDVTSQLRNKVLSTL